MTLKRVVRLNENEVLAEYPISGRVKGWYFRVQEVSASAYQVDGTDLWGRRVSRTGSDPDRLLDECTSDAEAIRAS